VIFYKGVFVIRGKDVAKDHPSKKYLNIVST